MSVRGLRRTMKDKTINFFLGAYILLERAFGKIARLLNREMSVTVLQVTSFITAAVLIAAFIK